MYIYFIILYSTNWTCKERQSFWQIVWSSPPSISFGLPTPAYSRWRANHFTYVFVLPSVKSNLHLANICWHPNPLDSPLRRPPSTHSILLAGRTSKWSPAMRVKGGGIALSVTRLPFRLSVFRKWNGMAGSPLHFFTLGAFAVPRRQKWSRQRLRRG